MTWRIPLKEIENFYDSKTQALLDRYGPGPRVHYHAGLFDEPEPLTAPPDVLKKSIVASQERLLEHAAKVWDASSTLCGDILDAGCGLGGGSLFWAQKFGAQVTAVTIASSHIPLIAKFAAAAGVSSQVSPFAYNVVEFPGENDFDAVVAFESSCHMPRQALFQRVAKLLRPEGRFFIVDYFFERPEYEEVWREHWYSPLGSFREYSVAAQAAGFRQETFDDTSHQTEQFWALTAALAEAEAIQKEGSAINGEKIEEALRPHRMTQEGLGNGGLRHALMSFVKSNN